MILFRDSTGGPPVYLTLNSVEARVGDMAWTSDRGKAFGVARKRDAEEFISRYLARNIATVELEVADG